MAKIRVYQLARDVGVPATILADLLRRRFNLNVSSIHSGVDTQVVSLVRNFLKEIGINVVFVGEYSSGKSSFLNHLIGYEIFDTDILPTTSGIYRVRYSDVPREDTVQEEKIQIYEIEYPFENLRKYRNYVFWDTPGLNSSDDYHNHCIDYALRNADVIVVTIDASQGTMKRTSIEKIKRAFDKPSLFLLTKSDKVSPSQLKSVKKYLKETVFLYFKQLIHCDTVSINEGNKVQAFLKKLLI